MQTDVKQTILAVQQYIEGHIDQPLTLTKLAKVAGYSPFHLERVFKEAVGLSIFEYIRKIRLTAAATVLRDKDVKVLDTALDFLFDSHEGFTRAFTREFGLTPSKYKKNPVPVGYFTPYHLHIEKPQKEKKMNTSFIFTQIVEKPQRKAIVKRGEKADGYFSYCEEVGCDVWGVLTSVKEAIAEPMGYWLPVNMRDGKSEYVQGVEVAADYAGAVPEGFELVTLPACTVMLFNGQPFDDNDFGEAIDEVWKAIEKFQPENYGYQWDNENPRFQLNPEGYRGYIEGRAVKKI
jgi:AraC-like DNA-binding protein